MKKEKMILAKLAKLEKEWFNKCIKKPLVDFYGVEYQSGRLNIEQYVDKLKTIYEKRKDNTLDSKEM